MNDTRESSRHKIDLLHNYQQNARMHTTLSVRSNLIMLGLYALILVTLLVKDPPPVAAVLLPFPLIGLAAGYAQFRAVKQTAAHSSKPGPWRR